MTTVRQISSFVDGFICIEQAEANYFLRRYSRSGARLASVILPQGDYFHLSDSSALVLAATANLVVFVNLQTSTVEWTVEHEAIQWAGVVNRKAMIYSNNMLRTLGRDGVVKSEHLPRVISASEAGDFLVDADETYCLYRAGIKQQEIDKVGFSVISASWTEHYVATSEVRGPLKVISLHDGNTILSCLASPDRQFEDLLFDEERFSIFATSRNLKTGQSLEFVEIGKAAQPVIRGTLPISPVHSTIFDEGRLFASGTRHIVSVATGAIVGTF